MLTPPEVRAVYVVDADGALTGVLTRKTLVAKVVAAGLDPRRDRDRRARRAAVLHDRRRHPARRGLPLSRGARRRARAGRRARPPRRRALAQRPAAASRRGRGAGRRRTRNDAFDVARARRETPGCEDVVHLNNAGASLMPDVVLRTVVEHLELEARIGGYEAAARERVERVEAVYDSIARLLGCSRDEVADRRERDPRLGHGVLLLRLRAGRPDPHRAAPSTRRTTSRCCRSRSARAPSSSWWATTRTGSVSLRRARGGARRAAPGSSRSSTCPRRVGSSSRPPRWGACAGRPECRCCSTRASRSGSCRPMWASSAATCSRRPGASSSAARAEPGSSTCGRSCSSGSQPPFLDLHAAEWVDRGHVHDPRRRPPLRELGDELRDEARTRRRGRLRARVGAAGDRGAGAGARGVDARRGSRRCPGWRCTIAGWRSAGSSRSRWPACRPRRSRRGSATERVNVSVTPVDVQPARSRSPRARGGRARVRPLLQHRGRGGAAGGARGRDGRVSEGGERGERPQPLTGVAPTPSRELRGSAVLSDPLVRELLELRLVAVLATNEPDGTVHAIPLWYARRRRHRSFSRRAARAARCETCAAIRGRRSSSTTPARASRSAARRSAPEPSWSREKPPERSSTSFTAATSRRPASNSRRQASSSRRTTSPCASILSQE